MYRVGSTNLLQQQAGRQTEKNYIRELKSYRFISSRRNIIVYLHSSVVVEPGRTSVSSSCRCWQRARWNETTNTATIVGSRVIRKAIKYKREQTFLLRPVKFYNGIAQATAIRSVSSGLACKRENIENSLKFSSRGAQVSCE